MKVLLINGSHRKGNTDFMLETIKEQAKKLNSKHVFTQINLRQKNIEFCNENDYNCDKTIECPNCCRDDMKDIYPILEQSDIIVFGSPVYFSNVSARIKNLMDRCNPYYFNQKLKGKSMVIVGVGESQNTSEFFSSLKVFARTVGLVCADVFYVTGDAPDTIKKDDKKIEELKEFTKLFLVSRSKKENKN